MVLAHVYFSGTVQGVGFRYTTLSFAQPLQLTGWVKNLPDGRVEAMVEGSRESVEKFLSQLKSHFGSFIREQHVEWLEPRGDFKEFFIT